MIEEANSVYILQENEKIEKKCSANNKMAYASIQNPFIYEKSIRRNAGLRIQDPFQFSQCASG